MKNNNRGNKVINPRTNNENPLHERGIPHIWKWQGRKGCGHTCLWRDGREVWDENTRSNHMTVGIYSEVFSVYLEEI